MLNAGQQLRFVLWILTSPARSLRSGRLSPVSTGIAQTVAPPPVSSQDGAYQEVKAMVQDIVKSSLTQLGVIPQDAPTQSQAQSSNEDPEPLR